MTFGPPGKARERILSFGGPGAGKTRDWVSIAERYGSLGDAKPGRFHIIDTDFTTERSLDGNVVAGSAVAKVWMAPEWEDYIRAANTVTKLARPDDWIVLDMITPTWEMCQEYYIERIFGKEYDEFFLKAREQNAKGNPLDGFKDWGVINKMYRAHVSQFILRAPCHVFATSAVAALSSDLEGKEIKQIYGKFGVKPVGQKANSHNFHSVLWKQNPKAGLWTLTTVKDRERDEQLAEPIEDFSRDYLERVAKWSDVSG